jgi:Holliday junction resolvase RusA-like endonuclease
MRFVVDLKPKPAPRPRGKGKPFSPREYEDWKRAFGFLVKEQLRVTKTQPDFSEVPLDVEIVIGADTIAVGILQAELARPSKVAGDIDNYAKAVLDALVDAGILANDRQVQRLEVRFGA